MLEYSFSFLLEFCCDGARLLKSRRKGHRHMSAANHGGEGFDTNGTQKTTVGKLVWTFRQSMYLVTCNCSEVNLCQLEN